MHRFLKRRAALALCAGALVTASAAMADGDAFATRLQQTRTDGIALAGTIPANDVQPAPASDVLLAGGPSASVTYSSYRPRPSEASYRPRQNPDPYGTQYRRSSSRSRGPSGFTELHGGVLEPDGAPEMQTLFGIKLAAMPDPRVHIGAMVDWAHKGNTVTEVVTTSTGPNGEEIRTQRELAEASTDLVPALAFLELTGSGRLPIIPYIGAGGGYQWLFLTANDFTTGAELDATYSGWAWQAWAGLAIPMGRNVRLNGEVFRTGGTVGRDLDELPGPNLREELDVDGVGLRVGLAFAF